MEILLILLSLVTWVSCTPPLSERKGEGVEPPAVDRAVTGMLTTATPLPRTLPYDTSTSDFYPFGPSAGDTANPKTDDGGSSRQSLPSGFRYFGSVYNYFWVNNNGLVSFEGQVSQFTPDPFPIRSFPIVAVFWGDIDTRRAGEVYWRQTTSDSSLITRVSQDILANYPDIPSFRARWVLVATYYDVTYYGGSSSTNRQSFQAVLATDGFQSFAIFKYGDILWTTGTASQGDRETGLGGIPAQAGFNAGDGSNYYTVPGSRSAEIVDIETRTNVGQPGTFMFRIDPFTIIPLGVVRLVGGSSEFEGRVEINRGGVWGTICDGNWGIQEAQVVCREIGHGGALAAFGSAHYGQGNGTIWLNNVDCTGNEDSLSTCPLLSNVTNTCTHANDAGVQCRDLDNCKSNPCQNGGTCLDRVDDFVCNCEFPYGGKLCDIDNTSTLVPPTTAVPVIIGAFISGMTCDGWTFFLVQNDCSSIYYVCSPGQDAPILMHCPASLVFNKDLGVCDWPDHVPYCSCQNGLAGASCQINLDDCSPNPCQNGGLCQDLVGDFVCHCLPSYHGKTCEIYVDPCDSGPCQNGGVCSASGAAFTCSCQPGWNGATCGMNIDECSPNPCQNGGVCQDLVADFSCSCPAPYEGKMCEIYVDPCGSGPCQNGGVCSATGAAFTCSCQPGWNGATCGNNIDECSPNPCQNGGVCQDLVADFSCNCPAPYEGKMCETYVSPCGSGPCQNGGVCSATGATFTCSCQPGWNGATCGINIDECSPDPCQNGGVCQDLVADFSCSCPPLYEGKTCEIYVSTPPPYVPTTALVITEGAVIPWSPGLTCDGLNFFLLDTDCSNIYYVCSPGFASPILMYCPATLVFNKDIKVCDNPQAVVYCP